MVDEARTYHRPDIDAGRAQSRMQIEILAAGEREPAAQRAAIAGRFAKRDIDESGMGEKRDCGIGDFDVVETQAAGGKAKIEIGETEIRKLKRLLAPGAGFVLRRRQSGEERRHIEKIGCER